MRAAKLIAPVLGALLLALPVSALTVDEQIAALLQQIAALQAQLAQLKGQSGSGASCVTLVNNMGPDDSDSDVNGEVSKLQQFLASDPSIYPEGRITGYFGPATTRAVQRWQSSHGVVSSGDPDSTGYGYVGPKTRAAMACGGGGASERFSAYPNAGSVPLAVEFTVKGMRTPGAYSIDFGDGKNVVICGKGENPCSSLETSTFYTYTSSGTYHPTLQYWRDNVVYPVGSLTITVTGEGEEGVTFSASPRSGAAPLAVSFDSANLKSTTYYYIDFGDGTTAQCGNYPRSSCGSKWSVPHTYLSAGEYVAGLWADDSTNCESGKCAAKIGGAIITVNSGSAAEGITVSPGPQVPNSLAFMGAIIPFTRAILKNTSSSPIIITSLIVERTGTASDPAFNGVSVWGTDQKIKLGGAMINSNHQAQVNTSLTIGAGASRTVEIDGDMALALSAFAGNTAGLSLVGIGTAATVSGSLPITGATHTINATLDVCSNPATYGYQCWAAGDKKPTLTASPISGPAPLTVTFSIPPQPGKQPSDYRVQFGYNGEKATLTPGCVALSGGGACRAVWSATHTYREPRAYWANLWTNNGDNLITETLITVTGGATQPPSVSMLSPNGGETFSAGQQVTIQWKTNNLPQNASTLLAIMDDRIPGWQTLSLFGSSPALQYAQLVSSSGTENVYQYKFVVPASFNSTLPPQYQNIYGGNHYKADVIVLTGGTAGTASQQTIEDMSDGTFTITGRTQQPTITQILPSSGSPGTTVYVHGSNFDQNSFVAIDGASGSVVTPTSQQPSLLTFVVPTLSAGPHTVQVGEKGGAVPLSNAVTFTVGPSLVSVFPSAGASGGHIVITGNGLSYKNSNNVYFGQTLVGQNLQAWGSGSAGYQDVVLNVKMPTGTYLITVQNENGTGGPNDANGNPLLFTVTSIPTISSVSPAAVAQGGTLTLNGSGFEPTLATLEIFDPAIPNQPVWNVGVVPTAGGTQVVVGLPSSLQPGSYLVRLRNGGQGNPTGGTGSNDMPFSVTAGGNVSSADNRNQNLANALSALEAALQALLQMLK